jgi:hypothetical protein
MTGCQCSEIVELPHTVNYSLHMHAQYPPQLRASTLNQLVSCRYEGLFSKPDWQGLIQVEPPLLDWIEERESLLSRH